MKERSTLTPAAMSTLFALGLALHLTACEAKKPDTTNEKPFARAAEGKALFEEKCRTVAGEKIYRKVENVDGVLLLKVRPSPRERDFADPMWPGAAFARESREDEYITTFLGYEHSSSSTGKPVSPNYRGYITTDFQRDNPSNLPGYRFVDVVDVKDGKRYRYSGSIRKHEVVSSILAGGDGKKHELVGWVLDRVLADQPAPRYAVTYEDQVIPEHRSVGVASSTVKVFDTQTGELLGELIRFAWSPSGPSSANPSPWLRAFRCPNHAVGTGAATRKFVDQVLLPTKEK